MYTTTCSGRDLLSPSCFAHLLERLLGGPVAGILARRVDWGEVHQQEHDHQHAEQGDDHQRHSPDEECPHRSFPRGAAPVNVSPARRLVDGICPALGQLRPLL